MFIIDIIYMFVFWLIYAVIRLLVIVVGIILSPIMMLMMKTDETSAMHFSRYYTDEYWKYCTFPIIFWPWTNLRDGVYSGDKRGWMLNYGREKGWSDLFIAWHWNFIRNPANAYSRHTPHINAHMPSCVVEVLLGQSDVDDKIGKEGLMVLKAKGSVFNYYTIYYVAKANDKGISPFIFRIGHKIKMSHNTEDWAVLPPSKNMKGWTVRMKFNVKL